ncbi:MAG: succinyl-diaminopimelate desuccinylase [Legionellaceae bacterium]|nr:succinyl-diaminopimelate desuccinylase [Legionellaceae bacterium]
MMGLEALLEKLVSFASITPSDAGCNAFMIQQLEQLGFRCQSIDAPPVRNFFARWGEQSPLLVFAGHTDVVPVGDRHQWQSDPFQLHRTDDRVYGRGVADMKGSLACMLRMAERFIHQYPAFHGSLGFLITSAEEGDDYALGTPLVMHKLSEQGVKIDYCVVGEPSSTSQIGDVIKIGRRGSLTANLFLQGKQGHVAYPHLADNPIHRLAPALAELTARRWDEGNQWFPPTSLQITQLSSGGHAGNVIPGELTMQFNFRFSPEQTEGGLKEQVLSCLQRHQLQPEIQWRLNGLPFLTEQGQLLDAAIQAITDTCGYAPELSTSGGTSDGRFIAPYGVEVIELGPVNASIHQVNEWVSLSDLATLETIYLRLCKQLLVR